MTRRHRVPSSLVWLVAPTLLGCDGVSSPSLDPPPVCDQVAKAELGEAPPPTVLPAAVDDLRSAFKRSISRAEPGVVSVYTTRTATAHGGAGHPFGSAAPFDFFFDRPPAPPRTFQQQALGSGFVLDDEGHILTNNHVVEHADEVKVKLSDDREFDAKVVGTDAATDLALLKIEAPDLHPIELGDSDALEVGDWVLAIGNPFGLPHTVSSGIVSAKGRANVGIVDYENFIQTDAAVNPGNSGGPLVDLEGRVVGINTAIASRSGGNQGIAFAIPVNMAKHVVDQLVGNGKVVRGHLGIMISELSPEMAASFGWKGAHGILVQDVGPSTAAERAGIRSGDIITQLDGDAVGTVADFRARVARREPGTSIDLQVWRDGASVDISAKLGELSHEGPQASSEPGAPPRIGIGLEDITEPLRRRFSLETSAGVVITAVEPGSPAARAGVRPGDVLEQIAGAPVGDARQAAERLRSADLDEGIRVRLRRDGRGRFVLLRAE